MNLTSTSCNEEENKVDIKLFRKYQDVFPRLMKV